MDLGDRIPVRVVGTPKSLRFYAKLIGLQDPLQWEELERVIAAAEARTVQGMRRPRLGGAMQ